jgi:hypothetical protein
VHRVALPDDEQRGNHGNRGEGVKSNDVHNLKLPAASHQLPALPLQPCTLAHLRSSAGSWKLEAGS